LPLRAEEPALNDVSALADFARHIAAKEPQFSKPPGLAMSIRPPRDANHESYFALLDFVQQIGVEGPQPAATKIPDLRRAGVPRDVDHEPYFALREFVTGIEPAQPSDQQVKLAAVEQSRAKSAKSKAAKSAPTKPTGGSADDAHVVGDKVCATCHAAHIATFSQTLMGKLAKNPRYAAGLSCESCHGPGSAHVKAGGGRGVGGIISFRKNDPSRSVEDNNALCLGCHEKGNRTLWRGSTHEQRDIACTNCHTVMRNVTPKHQLAMATEIDTCSQCHKNKRAEIWRSSHMPVREGKMTCSNCHNPHGSYSEALLKEATVNDTCYKCHAEKRGPFLWEHAPVRESCLNCHEAHGSNNDFMLKISRPRLCQQCHANLTGHPGNPRNPFSIYAINRECQNCHQQIHGSNSPSGARFHR
jgi:DmsE family decaheme c-type cytochrome